MGIQGLLPAIKSVIVDTHIENFRGKRVAVDGYAWLHKAVYGCCVELATGKEHNGWIKYCLNLVDMLLYFNIEVFIVFDGAELPAKRQTERERADSRRSCLNKANELRDQGDQSAARNFYARAVDITPLMAAKLIRVLRSSRPSVKVVVAPYEADAQLACLCHDNVVDAVIGEDSDTIPFGCTEMIYRLDKSGSCRHLKLSNLFTSPIPGFDLTSFTQEMIVCMCVASGCDYLGSLKGVGVKNAYKLVNKHREINLVLRELRLHSPIPLVPCLEGTAAPTDDSAIAVNTANASFDGSDSTTVSRTLQYELDFHKAVFTFAHQVVFDVSLRKTRYLRQITPEQIPSIFQSTLRRSNSQDDAFGIDVGFLGSLIQDPIIAAGIADGLVDPTTYAPFNLPDDVPRLLADKSMKKGDHPNSSHGHHRGGLTETSAGSNVGRRFVQGMHSNPLSRNNASARAGSLYHFLTKLPSPNKAAAPSTALSHLNVSASKPSPVRVAREQNTTSTRVSNIRQFKHSSSAPSSLTPLRSNFSYEDNSISPCGENSSCPNDRGSSVTAVTRSAYFAVKIDTRNVVSLDVNETTNSPPSSSSGTTVDSYEASLSPPKTNTSLFTRFKFELSPQKKVEATELSSNVGILPPEYHRIQRERTDDSLPLASLKLDWSEGRPVLSPCSQVEVVDISRDDGLEATFDGRKENRANVIDLAEMPCNDDGSPHVVDSLEEEGMLPLSPNDPSNVDTSNIFDSFSFDETRFDDSITVAASRRATIQMIPGGKKSDLKLRGNQGFCPPPKKRKSAPPQLRTRASSSASLTERNRFCSFICNG